MPTLETFAGTTKAIVCFGDSITFMAASRADRGYPSVLDELLFSQGFSVGNNGISGGGVQNAQDVYTLRHKGRGLWGACVLVGVNDIAAGTSAEALATAIFALVQGMVADGLRVVVSTILPWQDGGGWTLAGQAVTEAVNARILSLDGTDPKLRVVDGYSEFGQIDNSQLLQRGLQELTADYLHLGSYGAQALAKLMQGAIEELAVDEPAVTPWPAWRWRALSGRNTRQI